jgi:hypothetical protein
VNSWHLWNTNKYSTEDKQIADYIVLWNYYNSITFVVKHEQLLSLLFCARKRGSPELMYVAIVPGRESSFMTRGSNTCHPDIYNEFNSQRKQPAQVYYGNIYKNILQW